MNIIFVKVLSCSNDSICFDVNFRYLNTKTCVWSLYQFDFNSIKRHSQVLFYIHMTLCYKTFNETSMNRSVL